MKKMFLLMTSFVFLLTGCSTTYKPKNKAVTITKDNKNQESTEENKESKKEEIKSEDNKSESKNSTENKNVKTSQVKHDYAQAEKLVRESLFGGRGSLSYIYLFHYLNYDANRKTNEKYNVKTQNISETKLSFLVDNYNQFLPSIYNEQDVLDDITKKLRNTEYLFYKEVENDFNTEAVSVIQEIPDSKNGDKYGVVYFKKDKIFVSLTGGLGGAISSKPSDKSQWREVGEELIIPILENGKGKVGDIVLAINNKEYTGGEKRSYYYVKKAFK